MQDLIGRTLGHYRIVGKIGAGGMGVVYRAHDQRLDRAVAVKVLSDRVAADPDRVARFEREARAVARLNHANIVAIHDFGSDGGVSYAVMELLEGESLRGRLSSGDLGWRKAAEIGAAVAEGLAAAHGRGVVHRDLKPENIFLTADGSVKILDFGLARLALPVDGEAETASMVGARTAVGTVMGTVGYMSPEQVRGEVVDPRSDIFSLGCVLHEMLGGRRAFAGDTAAETMTAILRQQPESLSASNVVLPAELDRAVCRCLEKSREARFQSASDLAFALRSVGAGGGSSTAPQVGSASPRRRWWVAWLLVAVALAAVGSAALWFLRAGPHDAHDQATPARVVVLPFENLGALEDAYFADGITEEITARLAAVSGLQVISRTSARQYANTTKSLPEIGRELSVGYVVEGTVRWARGGGGESRIRVTPQLIRVADDSHVWAEIYDRVLDDVFDVQFEIAKSVTDHLGVVLAGAERALVESRPTENLDAYQAYLRGRHLASQPHFTYDNWERWMKAFEQAVELDPDFALAQAELARGHALAHYFRHDLSPARLVAADAAAERALALAPESPRVRLDLGYYRLWAYRDIDGALADFDRAAVGRPDDADILEATANVYLIQGRFDDALDAYQRAFVLSPRDAGLIAAVAAAEWTLRRYPEAIAACDQAIDLAPDTVWPYLYKTLTLWSWKGSTPETRVILEALPDTAGDWGRWAWYWQETLEGRHREAVARLSSPTDGWLRVKMWARPNAMLAAFAHQRLGETEAAAAGFETARKLLEPAVAASPEDPRLHSSLGIVYAVQGRRDDAVREGELACELLPRSTDGFYYIPWAIDLAHIYVLVGDHDAAIDRLEDLLDNPSWISAPWLRMDPRWDPLRGDPRFQKLLDEHPVEP